MKKRVLYIIAQEGFRDEEYFLPKQILEQAGVEVITSSITTDVCKGSQGQTAVPDIAVKDADLDDYDMIIMAGGHGAPKLLDYDEIQELFIKAEECNKAYGAICIAPMVLAKIGILDGKKATVFRTEESLESFKDYGAQYTGADVEVDGKVVTANGPAAAKDFARAILKVLGIITPGS